MVSNVAMTQFTSSAVVVYLMQKLKNAKWFPLIQEGKTLLNRSISIGSAAVIAVGVNYTWNPQSRGLLITIPTLGVAAIGFWHWLNQYALNEMLYRATVNKAAPANGNPPTPVVNATPIPKA